MSETIVRLYGSSDSAERVVSELLEFGYPDEDILVLAPPGSSGRGAAPAGADYAALLERLLKFYIIKHHAEIYAEGVLKGGTLITIHAPPGSAVRTTNILDAGEPIPSGVPEPEIVYIDYDEATPLSCILGLPILVTDGSTFSGFWSLPILTSAKASFSRLFGIPLLTSSYSSFSSKIGLKTLSYSASPFSSLFRIPLLW